MASKTRTFRKVASIITLVVAVLWNPFWVYNLAAGLVRSVAVPLISTPDSAINPTKAAIRNVTLDFDEVGGICCQHEVCELDSGKPCAANGALVSTHCAAHQLGGGVYAVWPGGSCCSGLL